MNKNTKIKPQNKIVRFINNMFKNTDTYLRYVKTSPVDKVVNMKRSDKSNKGD